ncbi:Leucine-rich repeat-containing protein let-4 [Portunus trituberculatus]|uniref:Leucine-rich repeat-containing protein let-4 n=1 Tax=Portunus trituberculatus TaxID=210409 RepID=A0A5B7CFG4_PORTR|nr:Leucine-rich repeat-containing protein let-4 [Portunus trituberculatus]
MKYQTASASNTKISSNKPEKGRARVPVPVSLADTKPSDVSCSPKDLSLWEAEGKARNRLHLSRYLKPTTSQSIPEVLPAGLPCKDHRRHVPNIATAPPDVCDLCPDENGKNPLDPCTGSRVDGALTRDIWGNLDFKYVSINDNKITDVDNGAFIGSKQTLISLNLANNEIKSFIALYNDLPNLLYLNLRGNNISLIFSEDYKYPSLTELDLSGNQITSIGTKSFAGLKKLKKLDMSSNDLTSIGDERFIFIDHNYSDVLTIDLSHNKISVISDKAFLGVRNVVIDFRFNQLNTLKEDIFYPIIRDSLYYAYFSFSARDIAICDSACVSVQTIEGWRHVRHHALSIFVGIYCRGRGLGCGEMSSAPLFRSTLQATSAWNHDPVPSHRNNSL